RGLLLTGKHPVAFLFVELPPDGVDVNVHPTKSEVRFRHPEKVQGLIANAVRKALSGEDLTAPLRVREAPVQVAAEQAELPFAAPSRGDRAAAPGPPPRQQEVSPRPAPRPHGH